jgi:XRE family aerobic/anaerobic benzoate catabolism transcriptional regulator
VALGERVRSLRARRGMTRKAVALAADVSERHLANLEYGVGNASILVLLQVARRAACSLAELIGDVTTSSPEWLMLRELLEHRDEATCTACAWPSASCWAPAAPMAPAGRARSPRVALVGLRGAGKSTLGQMLADDLGFPFVELSREIEKFAGCSINEIQALYGQNAYRRYERRALEEAIQIYPEAVIATPGGLVSDAGHLQPAAGALHHGLAAGRPRGPHEARGGAGRPAADGGQPRGHGRPEVASCPAARRSIRRPSSELDTSAQPLEPTFAALRRRWCARRFRRHRIDALNCTFGVDEGFEYAL